MPSMSISVTADPLSASKSSVTVPVWRESTAASTSVVVTKNGSVTVNSPAGAFGPRKAANMIVMSDSTTPSSMSHSVKVLLTRPR